MRVRTFRNDTMRTKGYGEILRRKRNSPGDAASVKGPRELIRVQAETGKRLAALRRPLLDSEGNLVGFESFDRLVRRLLDERRVVPPPHTRPLGAVP